MSSNSLDVIRRSQFIRAGAGAGKTTRLISTFLDFAREFRKAKGEFPRVVITTFTRKATQEVKERLLVSAVKEPDVFEYINKKSRVHISTIHGLLSLFLNQYADVIKFSSDIKIIDGPRYDKLIKRQMSELFKSQPEFIVLMESYGFAELVDIVKKALEYKAQNPNSAYISSDSLNKLAAEERNKIISTIDEIILHGNEASAAWKNYFSYLLQIKSVVEKNDIAGLNLLLEEAPRKPPWSESKPTLDPHAHELVMLLKDTYLDQLWDSDEFIKRHEELNCLFNSFLNKLYLINIEWKRKTGELTISDLESLGLQIIENSPESVIEFSNSWDFFMIDEYQDTSPVQVKILNAFVGDKPCFIVGDPQQSIYLFRGARSEVFATKQNEMEKASHQIDFLETNYRSEPSLMCFINDFFNVYSGQFRPMKLKESSKFEKEKFHDVYYVRGEDQSLAAIEHIQRLIRLGASPGGICVLSRNNKNLEKIALKAFEYGVDVQLQAAAGFEEKREIIDLICFCRFLVNPHDSDNLISFLRAPWVNISDQQLIDLRSDEKLSGSSLWEQLKVSGLPIYRLLLSYINLFDAAGVVQTLIQFVSQTQFLNLSRYYDRGGKREANIIKFITSLAESEGQPGFSLGQFLEEKFQSVSVDSGAADSEAQPVLRPDAVSLMTIHASKGLQFDHVILVGVSDPMTSSKTQRLMYDSETGLYSLSPYIDTELKQIPSRWSYRLRDEMNRRETEEFDRVLYVALTRAVRSLSLVSDSSKRQNKNTWYAKMNWPQVGEHKSENYTILSLESDNSAEIKQNLQVETVSVRGLYKTVKSQPESGGSVTEMLTGSYSADDRPQFDRQLQNLKKAQFGTDLHRIFEALKYNDKVDILKILSSEEAESVEYLYKIEDFDFKELLRKGHNEWGFGLQLKSKFIQGQIDLWAETDDAVYILDYKTGSSEFLEKAFEQLSFYGFALAKMNQIPENKQIFLGVIYPLERKTLKRTFADYSDFENKMPTSVKQMLSE